MADVHHTRCPKDMDPMWGQCACDVIDGLLADLRAKVEGLPPHGAGERMFVWRDDVLALLGDGAA